jgi:heme A synthase
VNRRVQGSRLSAQLRASVHLVFSVLWLSGVAWLLLHYFAARPGEFGLVRHPLEAPLMLVHGVVAMLALFVLGWFAALHSADGNRRRARRASGWVLSTLIGVLAIAGCLQFFVSGEGAQAALRLVHEVCGVALLLPVLAHVWSLSSNARAVDRGPARHHGHAHGHAHGRAASSHSVRN